MAEVVAAGAGPSHAEHSPHVRARLRDTLQVAMCSAAVAAYFADPQPDGGQGGRRLPQRRARSGVGASAPS
jgi:hypothetical protein